MLMKEFYPLEKKSVNLLSFRSKDQQKETQVFFFSIFLPKNLHAFQFQCDILSTDENVMK